MLTREEWLNAVATALAPTFAELGHPLPPYRVSIGFPSTGRRGKRIGEAWSREASADGRWEVFIRPDQADAMEVAAVLAHELAHVAVGMKAAHGPTFRRVIVWLGLAGPMRATTPGPAFRRLVRPILEEVGPLPHAKLGIGRAAALTTAPPKQVNRSVKCECPVCGYIARVSRIWLEVAGAPHCPKDGPMRAVAYAPRQQAGQKSKWKRK